MHDRRTDDLFDRAGLCIVVMMLSWGLSLHPAVGEDLAPDQGSIKPPDHTAWADDDSTQLMDHLDSPDPSPFNDFADLSLEELMSIEVTSVAGVEQPWFATPAAMYVITGDDLRRSGHRSIPEALRLVPGVNVARVASSQWAISARGFDDLFANKLLVLIDGRTVFDPSFNGTLWDVQDTVLEDIDRIEVIRGPGATLWGANAVNGVINVTTKSARDTQGLYVTGGGGSEEAGFGTVRYGGQIDDDAFYRVWVKYHNHDQSEAYAGGDAPDDWDMTRGGFRVDLHGQDGLNFVLDADLYNTNQIGESFRTPTPGHFTATSVVGDGRVSGGHVLARVEQGTDEETGWSIQGYYDRTNRVAANGFDVSRDTFDLDGRHRFQLGQRHEILWGLGYRHTRDRSEGTVVLSFSPADRSADTVTSFIQDTVTLIPETLSLMLGSKFEHNDFSGFEYQPSARLSWTPGEGQILWAAVSRPVRTPSRFEDDVRFLFAFVDSGLISGGPPSGVFIPITSQGNRDTDAEEVTAYELGYRVRVSEAVSIDAAAFYNEYRDLLAPTAGLTRTFANSGTAETYGVDVLVSWRPAPNWRMTASYSFLDVQTHGEVFNEFEGLSPHHTVKLHSFLDITADLEFNAALSYIDGLAAVDVDAYFRLDLGITWRPTDSLELTVWGQNLLDGQHPEFRDSFGFIATPAEVERGVYAQATLRF